MSRYAPHGLGTRGHEKVSNTFAGTEWVGGYGKRSSDFLSDKLEIDKGKAGGVDMPRSKQCREMKMHGGSPMYKKYILCFGVWRGMLVVAGKEGVGQRKLVR